MASPISGRVRRALVTAMVGRMSTPSAISAAKSWAMRWPQGSRETILPGWLQYFAWALPPTYVFEGMRALVIDHVFRADLMPGAFALNVVMFAAASFAFLKLCQSARVQGSLLQTSE